MPSRLFKQMLERLKGTDSVVDKESSSLMSRLKSDSTVDSTSTSSPLLPPPTYSDASCSINYVSQPMAAPPIVRTQVIQLCPHETMSFERLQVILDLPNFKKGFRSIDASGATTVPQHSRSSADSSRMCKLDKNHSKCTITRDVRLIYVNQASHADSRYRHPRLEIRSNWHSYDPRTTASQMSKEYIRGYLNSVERALCPHQALDMTWLIDTYYLIVHSDKQDMDPVDEWLIQADGTTRKPYRYDCPHCATVYKVSGISYYISIDIERFLGRGTSATDPEWAAQCNTL